MIKVAEFINGKIICGSFDKDDIPFPNSIFWNHVLFVEPIRDVDGKRGIRFSPVARYGDFEQSIEIKNERFVYIYDPGPRFIQTYRKNVAEIRERLEEQKSKSDIVIASPADVPKGRFKPI